MSHAAPSLQFLGGAGTVTGAMYLVRATHGEVLLDCGLFQGLKPLRLRNWAPRVAAPADIAAVVLSHAHIDHIGYLPLLVKQGFRGPVYCTAATGDLVRVLLPDCAHLQEEEADRANRVTARLSRFSASGAERARRRGSTAKLVAQGQPSRTRDGGRRS